MKIDITGLDFDMVKDFVLSRYAGEATAAERMASSVPGGGDPFSPLAPIKPDLTKFAQSLKPDLSEIEIYVELQKVIHRTD